VGQETTSHPHAKKPLTPDSEGEQFFGCASAADVFVGSVRNPEDPDAVNETVGVDDSVEGVHAAVSCDVVRVDHRAVSGGRHDQLSSTARGATLA